MQTTRFKMPATLIAPAAALLLASTAMAQNSSPEAVNPTDDQQTGAAEVDVDAEADAPRGDMTQKEGMPLKDGANDPTQEVADDPAPADDDGPTSRTTDMDKDPSATDDQSDAGEVLGESSMTVADAASPAVEANDSLDRRDASSPLANSDEGPTAGGATATADEADRDGLAPSSEAGAPAVSDLDGPRRETDVADPSDRDGASPQSAAGAPAVDADDES